MPPFFKRAFILAEPLLCAPWAPPHLNLTMTSIKLGFITFILQMKTPKLREVKSFPGGHTTVSPVEPGFKPVPPGYKVHTLNFLTNLLLHEMCRAMPILQVRRLMQLPRSQKEEPGCKLGAAALLFPAVQCYDQIHRGELQQAALRRSQARWTP